MSSDTPNSGIAVEGEADGGSLSPIEVRASAKGWRPLEQFKGNPEDWVDAKEFLGREKLFGKIKELKGENHRLQVKFDKDMEVIAKHMAETEERAFKRAKAELQAQRKAALKEGDAEHVEHLESQLEQLEKDKEAALAAIPKPQPQSGPTPAFLEFQERNEWFQLDPKVGPKNEMTEDAIAIGTGYAAANPSAPQEKVLAYVEKKIKAMYPEARGEQADENEATPSRLTKKDSGVETGTGGNRGNTGGKKTKISRSDLSEDQRRIMDTLVKRGALKEKAAKNKVSQETQYLMDLQETLA